VVLGVGVVVVRAVPVGIHLREEKLASRQPLFLFDQEIGSAFNAKHTTLHETTSAFAVALKFSRANVSELRIVRRTRRMSVEDPVEEIGEAPVWIVVVHGVDLPSMRAACAA
jgi:hypothetical protein